MKRILSLWLIQVVVLALAVPAVKAGTDEFLGDSSIYSGVPTTSSNPNVLIIIDNSRSTLNTAGGQPYKPWLYDASDNITGPNQYPVGFRLDPQGNPTTTACSTTVDSPANGCFLPWNIYELDNQGDFSQRTLANADETLGALTCDPSGDASKPIHKALVEFGSYSGAASSSFPTIASTGGCITSGNNNSGRTYALGNFLNYTKGGGASTSVLPVTVPAECSAPNPVVMANEWKNGAWTSNKYAYFQLKTTHTSDSREEYTPYAQQIGTGINATVNTELVHWNQLPQSPAPAQYTSWGVSTPYTTTLDKIPTFGNPDGKTCAQLIADSGVVTPTASVKTQREIMNEALAQVIKATAGVVNFGAMVYGDNNSGARIINSRYNSAVWTDMQNLALDLVWDPNSPPDCTLSTNASLKICKFIKALPGPGENDGAPLLSSNTNRPLGESVFDAGYYFGATYTSVTNTRRIPDAIKNPCDLNHIILLTNGFSNGDGSPNLSVIGDADGDGANEQVYGLGSHWLDDVAKSLNVNYKIKTHTVLAFQAADALIVNAAKDGGGQFYNVFSAEELSAALLKLLSNIINESNTSFVAPVVPASTTNRTISSNKVYLGLFRPQQDAAWHGNIKKYGLSPETNLLTDKDGNSATDIYGNFDRDRISYWSVNSSGLIPTATTTSGYIDPNLPVSDPDYANTAKGDGGQVDSGGAGGVLLERMKSLRADINSSNNWSESNAKWRQIYTYLDSTKELWEAENRFLKSNTNITPSLLNLRDSTGTLLSTTEKDKLVLYTHGFDVDLSVVPGTVGVRKWVLGDVLHSRPLVFNYTKYPDLVDATCPPNDNADVTSSNTWNSSVVYVGANDGMMHAFRDCDGKELWAFIPPNNLPYLQYVKTPEAAHASFVDSPPSVLVHDQNEDGVITPGTDSVVLLFGQRRGGGSDILDDSSRGSYTALDVSNPYQPKLLWQFDNANLSELGETWSQPRMAKIKTGDNSFKVVMFVGVGYDNNEDFRFGNTQTFYNTAGLSLNSDATTGGTVDGSGSALVSAGTVAAESRNAPRGRGIVAVEIANYTRTSMDDDFVPSVSGGTVGTTFWSYTNSNSTSTDLYNSNLKYSFPSDLTVNDADGNGYADTIYAGDTGGNLWRFDISNASKALWDGEIIFTANPGSDSTNGRKIFYRPAVVNVGAPHIYFGTGDREHPLNLSTVDRLYCVIDWKNSNQDPTNINKNYPLVEGDLDDMTLNQIQDVATTQTVADQWRKRLYSSPGAPYNPFNVANTPYTNGWYIKLDGTDRNNSGELGEKMLAPATVFNGEVFFSTYQIYTGERAGCDAGNLGISRLYHLDYKTGEAVMNYDASNDLAANATLPGNERAVGETKADGGTEILQRTDRVRTLGEGIPSGIVTIIDASGNVTQLISSSDKVESSSMTDVKLIAPVYWMQW